MVESIKKSYWRDSLIVFARMSVWIGGPIIIALFFGKWLDVKFGTGSLLFIITIAAAFLVSSLGIVREARRYMTSITNKLNSVPSDAMNHRNGTDNTNNANK